MLVKFLVIQVLLLFSLDLYAGTVISCEVKYVAQTRDLDKKGKNEFFCIVDMPEISAGEKLEIRNASGSLVALGVVTKDMGRFVSAKIIRYTEEISSGYSTYVALSENSDFWTATTSAF